MDYDRSSIATTYDEARALTPARRRHWQGLLSAHVDRTAIALVYAIIKEVVAPDWPSFVRKSALRADSFLARLSDKKFDRGMAALRAHRANSDPNEAVTEEIDWFVFTKCA